MKLSHLLEGVTAPAIHGNPDLEVSAVCADSRLVSAGALFVAVPGFRQDGAQFVASAIARGAVVVVTLPGVVAEGSAVTVVEVADTRAALSVIAANFHGRPADKLSLAGVTGTSGKTTTTRMIESILDAGGEPVGLIGTIEYRAGDERLVADRTTPDAIVLQEWFARMVAAGVHHAVMEVSSHALALERTYGVHFAAAVFTNLSRDHFDFHKDFDDYFAAKRKLFDQIPGPEAAVVNRDDEYGRRLISELGARTITFGTSDASITPAEGFEISVRGLQGKLHTPAGPVRVESAMLGLPNLYNWMGAVGAAIVLGIPVPQIEEGIRRLHGVSGRFERVKSAGGLTVLVDYAHKPDALDKLLRAVRDLAGERRLSVVLGCGGDRDKGKRPQMGAIAAELADYTILTSDNPRGEKPEAILDDIESGMTAVDSTRYERIADRRQAIARAIARAGEDEVVVIAGKGHETYQVVGDQVIHFDDREEAEFAIKKRYENIVPKST